MSFQAFMNKAIPACAFLGLALLPSAVQAKTITVKVDGRSAPWRTGANPKMAFGLADAKAPTVVFDQSIRSGAKMTITATGQTTTLIGGGAFGPDGQSDWVSDRGAALFPSHYMSMNKRAIHLNELVGAFISADGIVVGKPFPLGSQAEIRAPEGAAALSLGINDDRFSDNTGSLTVTIVTADATVTVEGEPDGQ